MPRDFFIKKQKSQIDANFFRNLEHLETFLGEWAKDEEEKQILIAYYNEKNPQLGTAFSSTFTKLDFQQIGIDPFEENKDHYVEFSPQYWFKYFWTEVKKEKLSADEANLGFEALNALFIKEAAPELSRGFRLRLRPSLVPTIGPPATPTAAPSFGLSSSAADTWRSALSKLLQIGFRSAPANPSSTATSPTENSMLERQFVSQVKGSEGQVRVFWRADGRGKEAFAEGAKRSVEDDMACARYALNQAFHPFSDSDIKKYMWFRKGNADNDFYTVVSVTVQMPTAATFPLIDERRAYQMPLKSPEQWSETELKQYRNNLAEVSIEGSSDTKVLIATKSNVYMLAINGGVVIDTMSAGAHYRGEDKGFPENGIKGYPFEAFMGVIPIIRVYHGPNNAAGFTTFLSPTENYQLFLTGGELFHRFGKSGAQLVINQFYDEGVKKLQQKMQAAWSSHGAVEPGAKLGIKYIRSFPISDYRLKELVKIGK